jgi:pyruvate-formate lyase-activating enzyme
MKAFDPVLHRRITGMDNEPVLAFARRLATLQRPMWLRYVLVPGLSDDPDEISRVADRKAVKICQSNLRFLIYVGRLLDGFVAPIRGLVRQS